MKRDKPKIKIRSAKAGPELYFVEACPSIVPCNQSPLEQGVKEGENPVCGCTTYPYPIRLWTVLLESECLGLHSKVGGKLHLRLNTGERPIANKYREGKLKSTLERESNST